MHSSRPSTARPGARTRVGRGRTTTTRRIDRGGTQGGRSAAATSVRWSGPLESDLEHGALRAADLLPHVQHAVVAREALDLEARDRLEQHICGGDSGGRETGSSCAPRHIIDRLEQRRLADPVRPDEAVAPPVDEPQLRVLGAAEQPSSRAAKQQQRSQRSSTAARNALTPHAVSRRDRKYRRVTVTTGTTREKTTVAMLFAHRSTIAATKRRPRNAPSG